MEISPGPETKPSVRRRLIQSTLFPHRSQDNAAKDCQYLEPDVDHEDDEEDCREIQSQNQCKKNNKRKSKAVPRSRASRKLSVNGKETESKNTNEEDSPVTVKVDFFDKLSEKRRNKRQQQEHLFVPEENEQSCSPPDVITNSKSPQKPRRRANSTPKKRRSNATPEKQRKNVTPVKNGINSALDEAYCGPMLGSPDKPIPNLRLEAKMTAEENSRIFAGKQIHPFFSFRKTGKKNMDVTSTENKWCHIEGKESDNEFSPIHIFEKTQGETFSIDWGNWTFSDSSFMSTGWCPEGACSLILEGSVGCLQFDNYLVDAPMESSLCQSNSSSIQYPIQLEENSLNCCSMPLEKCPVISPILVDKKESPCNHLQEFKVDYGMGRAGDSSDNTKSALKSNFQWPNTLTPERVTSNIHDCNYQLENSLWTNKYQPEKAVEICGNFESVRFLNEWLRLWHEKGSKTSKCLTQDDDWIVQDVDLNYTPSDCDSEDDDEETGLKNVLVVTGPVGSGKSAAIYACAKEQGFQVIEVNTSDWRNGALVKQKFGEAVESHWLQCSMQNLESLDSKKPLKLSPTKSNVKAAQRSNNEVIELIALSDCEDSINVKPVGKENTTTCAPSKLKTLILFEDVDATLDEDRGFITTIQQLAETAKRPMILTSNSEDPDLPNNLDRLEVSFTIPSSKELLSLASMVCAAEKTKIEPCLVERFINYCQGDIRKTIMLLQFWCQGQNQRKESEVPNTYAPLVFDINAGHQVLPQLVPCGYTSKLSEMIEKEITKSMVMAEKDACLMEIIEEEEENNSDSRMDINEPEPDSIEARKDEMLRRHCSDQDENNLAAQCADLPSCSNSPVTFARKISRRNYDAVVSSDSEKECLNEGLPNKNLDVNSEMVDARFSSEEEFSDEILCDRSMDLNAEVLVEANSKSPSHFPSGKRCFNVASEQLLSEGVKLDTDFHPYERPYYSDINGSCKSGDVSCVPESSFVAETEIENGTMMYSAMYSHGCVDSRIEEASKSPNFMPKAVPREFNSLDDCSYEENKGEEVGDSHIEPNEALPREFQMMDECSRIDFSRKAESMHRPSADHVQETWRKLRSCDTEVKQYVSIEEKNTLEVLQLSYGMSNLISEADLLFNECQSLTCDYVRPSMVPTEKSHSFSWYDDQLQIASTTAQHGFCFYAKRSAAARSSSKVVDLAWEMLTESTNAISLGKLINQSKRLVQSLGNGMLQSGVPSKSTLEPSLCSTVQSVVPIRSQLSLRGYIFHEYLSSLVQISRSESSRISQGLNNSKQRRKRVARNYLSNGALGLSPVDLSLLDQYSCYQKRPLQSKSES